jgi:hypothetical protein
MVVLHKFKSIHLSIRSVEYYHYIKLLGVPEIKNHSYAKILGRKHAFISV